MQDRYNAMKSLFPSVFKYLICIIFPVPNVSSSLFQSEVVFFPFPMYVFPSKYIKCLVPREITLKIRKFLLNFNDIILIYYPLQPPSCAHIRAVHM
jgi:hypothetical protein